MKHEQLIGKHGEQTARSVLHGLGLEFIEKVGTPVLLRKVIHRLPNVFQVIWGERVAGDHRAIFPDGRSVLIEVKTILDRNLQWGDLREHQPGKLSEHDQFNGLSLLVWIHDNGVYVLRWPVPGFGPGKGITPLQASNHHLETINYIQDYLERSRRTRVEVEKFVAEVSR